MNARPVHPLAYRLLSTRRKMWLAHNKHGDQSAEFNNTVAAMFDAQIEWEEAGYPVDPAARRSR